jgi:hypothetical protein
MQPRGIAEEEGAGFEETMDERTEERIVEETGRELGEANKQML